MEREQIEVTVLPWAYLQEHFSRMIRLNSLILWILIEIIWNKTSTLPTNFLFINFSLRCMQSS